VIKQAIWLVKLRLMNGNLVFVVLCCGHMKHGKFVFMFILEAPSSAALHASEAEISLHSFAALRYVSSVDWKEVYSILRGEAYILPISWSGHGPIASKHQVLF